MNSSNQITNYKSLFINNLLLITLCLFVVIYIISNYQLIIDGKMFNGNYIKSILITGIIILILYLYATWDDNQNNTDDISIQKFKLNNINKNSIIENPTSGKNKYIIINNNDKFNINNNDKSNINNKIEKNSLSKLEDTNIFISQKKINKYGLKF